MPDFTSQNLVTVFRCLPSDTCNPRPYDSLADILASPKSLIRRLKEGDYGYPYMDTARMPSECWERESIAVLHPAC